MRSQSHGHDHQPASQPPWGLAQAQTVAPPTSAVSDLVWLGHAQDCISNRFPGDTAAAWVPHLRTIGMWLSITLTLQWLNMIKAYFLARQSPLQASAILWNHCLPRDDAALLWLHHPEHTASLLRGRKYRSSSPLQLHTLAQEWLPHSWNPLGRAGHMVSPESKEMSSFCAWKERRPRCG